jgi:protein ImuA
MGTPDHQLGQPDHHLGTPDRQQRLVALRDAIADIERKPALAETRPLLQPGDATDFPLPAGGLLQEIFTDEQRHAGAMLGFALAQARSLLTPARPAVIYLQLARQAQDTGLPYGPGLLSFGFDPQALLLVRPASIAELLWATEEALACRAVAAVVADVTGAHKALDFTASRRLSMRAASMGSSVLLLRYGAGREASAAQLRWRLTPVLSALRRFDALAPGAPRWLAQLEKGILRQQQTQWLLGWTHDGLTTHDAGTIADRTAATQPAAGPALSQPLPAQLADRLPQAR